MLFIVGNTYIWSSVIKSSKKHNLSQNTYSNNYEVIDLTFHVEI